MNVFTLIFSFLCCGHVMAALICHEDGNRRGAVTYLAYAIFAAVVAVASVVVG